ncbi:MAG: peptide chain release factor 1, partial [Erysipelothrix sp.]|nr:peptide chain release factor 1 [Erysipelothrix sp.]
QEEVYSDPKQMATLGKEHTQNQAIMEPYLQLKETMEHLKQAQDVLKNESDDELLELAEMEVEELTEKQASLKERLEVLLIPKDPQDDHNAIVEIRGAAGGDEGNIFAGDLYRMYVRYCENIGYKTETLEASASEAGGYTLVSFKIKGNGAYGHFKFESGSHRVQRVPKTETQGRIHTSTATVLVLPEVEEQDVDINPDDLVYDIHHATGAGGQHVNKTASAVRITHTPTGISVNMQEGRSQHANRDMALQIIRARVYDYYEQERLREIGEVRKSKIGSGDRSEKIRTYNYPQNRVSDHRINLTITQLDRIMEGKLEEIIEALIAAEQKERLS